MKFNPDHCPQCHHGAVSICESVLVEAGLDYDPKTGEFGYDGGSDVFWDTQEPIAGNRHTTAQVKDSVYLQCDQGHHWWAKFVSADPRELHAKKGAAS